MGAQRTVKQREEELAAGGAGSAATIEVGAANDREEARADGMAAAALRRLGTAETVHRSAGGSASPGTIGAEGGQLDAGTTATLEAARGGGAPLEADVRQRMEAGFGRSFGDVRVHTDPTSHALNRHMSAEAFSTGRDVFFGEGAYAPGTAAGEQVLAHELAHTVQGGAAAHRTIRRWNLGAKKLGLKANTQVLRTVSSGQSVFFLEDKGGDQLVVKADETPAGVNSLFAQVHQKVSGQDTVRSRAVEPSEKPELIELLENPTKADPGSFKKVAEADAQKTPPRLKSAVAEWENRLKVKAPGTPHQQAAWLQAREVEQGHLKLTAMAVAKGKDVEELASPGGATGGERDARTLFTDKAHMKSLGIVTALDILLGNSDRLLSGNLGNWFVDPAKGITLIDNVNPDAKVLMQYGHDANLGGFDISTDAHLSKLRSGGITALARELVDALLQGMAAAGDTGAATWATTKSKALGGTPRARMEKSLAEGLKEGRRRIQKTFTTKAKSANAKALKGAAEAAGAEDGAQNDYWGMLVQRAQYLK